MLFSWIRWTYRIVHVIGALACIVPLQLAHAQASPQNATQVTPQVVPPQVLTQIEAVYPQAALAARQEALVILQVVVGTDGSVRDATVVTSGGDGFDAAAMAAMRQWTFRPAQRDGVAIESRIRVPFRFALPAVEIAPAPVTGAAPTAATPPTSEPATTDESIVDVRVRGWRPPPPRATSDFVLSGDILTTAPHQSAGDLLSSAPGVYVAKPEGDAVAHQVFLRGFDAEHGQDIAFTMGAIPINQPSHIHGQGYADLNFVIPEVVRSVRVTEGVYDPRQGDFAVAGSIDFDLGVVQRGYQFRSTYGSFNTFRQLALWAPKGESEETFGAVSIRKTDGFGQNRGSLAGGGIGQFAFDLPGGFHGLAHVSAYGARANLAGVLREDDVQAGRVGFYDTYANPSATAQSALSSRAQAGINLERATATGARTGLAIWLALNNFRSRTNFTGFMQRSRMHPDWVGRGDLIEQDNDDIGLGARAFQRTPHLRIAPWLAGNFEIGTTFRTDWINQGQNLIRAPQNETWDQRVDATVRASDIGAYVDGDWRITRYVHVRGGMRADLLHYDINDRLGNFIPNFQQQTHIVGYRRTAMGIAYGPRATVEVKPLTWLSVLASYGEGYRSPQARQLEEGENAPFAKVRSFEGGFKLHPGDDERFIFTSAAYGTFLSTDLVFDPQEGRLERIGPTRRLGFVSHVIARPWRWAVASASVTYVHATLREPPAATATNPTPAYRQGQLVPYVPPVVVRADLGVHGDLFKIFGAPVNGRMGSGTSFLSARPLPYGQTSPPIVLVDLSAFARWRMLELGIEIFNLLNKQYAATPYSFVSDWGNRDVPSMVPARHFAAGAPRTFMGTLAVQF